MILAAGLGTRLRPLTNDRPKALVKVGKMPMLEHVARRLTEAGATRLVINVHHHADQIREFLKSQDNFGVEVFVSEEAEKALETGGGIKQAEPLFRKDGPILVHNADMLTDIDLRALYDAQAASDTLAGMAVQPAVSPRYLAFDEAGRLCGYGDRDGGDHLSLEPQGNTVRYDFCGVQAISPRVFDLMTETGVFSIISTYLRLAKEGEVIRPHRVDGATCIDVGNHERLAEARARFG